MLSEADLRPSQNALIREMTEFPAGIAVLGMGGGKTASFLTAVKNLIAADVIDRAVVLAPPRTLYTAWGPEPGKWEHLSDVTVLPVDGTPARRVKKMQQDADVYVVSIDLTKWLVDYLLENSRPEDRGRTLLGIDEISKYKGVTSKLAHKLLQIASSFNGVWGLTGTPRHNGYMDLYQPIRLVGGTDAWGTGDFVDWRSLYFRQMDYQGYDWQPHPFAVDKLERIAQEWLVYAPVDDLKLPELHTGDDYVRHVELTEQQVEMSKDLRDTLVTQLRIDNPDADDDEIEMMTVQAFSQGVVSGKLVQIAQGFLYDEQGHGHALDASPKLDMLLEMDQELGGDRAVIVYGLREEINVINKTLGKHNRIGRLGGGVSPKQAGKVIEDWRAGKLDRLLLHPASAGHGVDGLQDGGHHMIHFHPTWSAEMYDQVIKRLHRPGQKHDVFNWWIKADRSVDEIKYARVARKLKDAEDFKALLRNIV